mmetsp:Transcript_18690/g.52832  ORF Transcript_18690/g.52832 Transcript_18690/m.52832 type:complete len:222 (-) Transcript_18690:320-985(-)
MHSATGLLFSSAPPAKASATAPPAKTLKAPGKAPPADPPKNPGDANPEGPSKAGADAPCAAKSPPRAAMPPKARMPAYGLESPTPLEFWMSEVPFEWPISPDMNPPTPAEDVPLPAPLCGLGGMLIWSKVKGCCSSISSEDTNWGTCEKPPSARRCRIRSSSSKYVSCWPPAAWSDSMKTAVSAPPAAPSRPRSSTNEFRPDWPGGLIWNCAVTSPTSALV